MALTGECSTVEARTATAGFRVRRPIAVAGLAPLALSLLTSLLLPIGAAAPAAADQSGSDEAKVVALAAKIHAEAGHIHQLTEQLDQARLRVNSTSSRLAGVTKQHDSTVVSLGANRAILLEQAVRAYMHGGATPGMPSASASADVTLGQEYLRVASGDLANTSDQLRQLEADLRSDLAMLRAAQQANVQATVQLQSLRTNALSIATKEQAQLDSLQVQLVAQSRAAAAAHPNSSGATGATTQGHPVNNGLVSVVQQAIGLPVATPVATPVVTPVPTTVTTPTTTATASSGGGGHAGGVWLSLRRCESSDTYDENTGNGYYGAYQFSPSTWTGLGFPGRPDQASPAMQDEAAAKLQAVAGWGQWPACAAALGLL